MPSSSPDSTPTRAETLAALEARRSDLIQGGVAGFQAREDDVLVILRGRDDGPRTAFAYLWPDAELTGESTGEPQESLGDWVTEVGLDLDEFLATEPAHRRRGVHDAQTGYGIVRRYGTGA